MWLLLYVSSIWFSEIHCNHHYPSWVMLNFPDGKCSVSAESRLIFPNTENWIYSLFYPSIHLIHSSIYSLYTHTHTHMPYTKLHRFWKNQPRYISPAAKDFLIWIGWQTSQQIPSILDDKEYKKSMYKEKLLFILIQKHFTEQNFDKSVFVRDDKNISQNRGWKVIFLFLKGGEMFKIFDI